MKVQLPLELHSKKTKPKTIASIQLSHLMDVDNISTWESFPASAAEPQHFAPGRLADPLPDGFHMLPLFICVASGTFPLPSPAFCPAQQRGSLATAEL